MQYQEYKAKGIDAAIESGKNYVNGALGGFVEKPYNAVINNINGLSEPFRAGEKSLFGTGYIPELPRSTIGDKSAYWQQNRYGVSLNQIGEGATTLQVGIMTGKPLFNSRAGALLGVQVGAYNIGVGAGGTDPLHPGREMSGLERGSRIIGGTMGVASAPFSTGGRALANDALAFPNTARNTVNNLDEIFRPPTNPPLAPAGNVPNEFAFGNRRIFSADEPTIPNNLGGKTIVEPQKGGNILEIRGDYRINVRRGNGKTGTGMEYAWRRHGGTGTSNKSQFSISRQEAEALLQGKDVIKSPAIKDASSGNYIREVDVKKVVGNLAIDKGGQPTTIITVITDDAGNLINVFPGRLGFKAK
ncbi:MAG: hypothetical protein H0X72_16290 [Acidobacteria bacterium]|nr:hypothetical protein [Acidobacteriota bacterium]